MLFYTRLAPSLLCMKCTKISLCFLPYFKATHLS
jgi:hypothetical protein